MGNQNRQYRELSLKDGRTVRTCRVESSDTDLFVEFFEGITPENRQFMDGFRFDREMAERITGALNDHTWYPPGSLRNSRGNVTHADGSTLFNSRICPTHGDKL